MSVQYVRSDAGSFRPCTARMQFRERDIIKEKGKNTIDACMDQPSHPTRADVPCFLSTTPSAPDCVVLLVEPDFPFIWYCRAGDSKWEEHEYDIGSQALPGCQPPEEKVLITPIAACRGKFYFNSSSTKLGIVDFCGGAPAVLSSIGIDDTMDENYGYKYASAKVFLLESDDELYMVRLLSAGVPKKYRGANVYMMDFSTRRWRRVDDLSGRTFLLSMYEFGASTLGGGESGLQQNCVYFMGNPQQKSLHVFSVKDGSAEIQEFDDAPTLSDKAFWMLSTDL